MKSRAIFAETLGVQEGSSIVHLLFVLNAPLCFFLGVQVPHFPYRIGKASENNISNCSWGNKKKS